MSLTSFLAGTDVKEKFREEFSSPKFGVEKELLAPPLTNHYSLVGTAFDYLMRFYLKHLNPNAVVHRWVAEISLELIKDDRTLHKKASNIVSETEENYLTFLKAGKMDDRLIRSALLLAQLDPIYRAGIVDENIGVIDAKDVEDMKNLISFLRPEIFKASRVCLLDPTFGEASVLVGGADVDLVIDDAIIDIKTTKKFELRRDYFNQLLGYYILYRIGGIDGAPPKHEITRLGVYFSRHAYLHVFNVRDVVNEGTFPDFMKWFKKKAGEEYGSVPNSQKLRNRLRYPEFRR